MGVLSSRLFTEGDQATLDRLENCATGRPNEVLSHFVQGQQGPHITKVQQALKSIQDNERSLGIPEFDVNGIYDKRFADAIAVYKAKRDLKNFANKIDNIVGIKTIRSLDNDAKKRTRVEPEPKPKKPNVVPRPTPGPLPATCLTDDECPPSRSFSIRLLSSVTAGEIVEGGAFLFSVTDTHDPAKKLSCLYQLKSAGLGTPSPIPVNVSFIGKPSSFVTSSPTRVTRFGPVGGLGSFTVRILAFTTTVLSELSFSFKDAGTDSIAGTVFVHNFDTGFVNLPGAGIQGGIFEPITLCRGSLGADKVA